MANRKEKRVAMIIRCRKCDIELTPRVYESEKLTIYVGYCNKCNSEMEWQLTKGDKS